MNPCIKCGNSLEEYYVLIRNKGISVMVKEANFFRSQGGLEKDWGKNWILVEAESIEHARSIGEKIRDTE